MTSIPSHLWLATLSVSAVVHAAIVLPSLAFEEPQAAGIYAPKSDRSAPLQVDIAPAHSMTVRFDPPKKAELPQPPPEPVLAPIPTEQVAAPEPPTPEPPPEVTPPKVAKRTPARKARRARPDPVEPPKVAAGHAQRITSTGDTPDPEGPPPSDLQNAGSGAVADAASHAPGGASPDGTDDGVGAQPATPARPAVDRDRLLRRYLRKVARAVQTRFEYPRAAVRAGMEAARSSRSPSMRTERS